MLKVLVFIILIFASLCYFFGGGQEVKKEGDEVNHVENSKKIYDLSENDSESDTGQKSKEFYEHDTLHQRYTMKYNNLVKTVDNYVQRYINLFLITSNLRDHEVKDLNELITVDLEISITGEDLIYLQGYSRSSPAYPKSFSKLDAILYKIAKLKERSILENAMKKSTSFFYTFNITSIFNSPNFSKLFSISIALLVTLLLHFYFTKRIFYLFGALGNILLFWESLNLYKRKVKEVEVEIYVKNMELRNASEKCNFENIGWYDTLLNFFIGNKCLEYHKNLNKIAEEEVSLFGCIVDTYSYYLFQIPFKKFGASIRDFTTELSNNLPWPFNLIISTTLIPFFILSLLLFITIFYTRRFRMSFFGAAVEIGGGQPASIPEIPKTIRSIRKLRPWTKSRLSKRMEIDFGKRRKLLKSTSLSEVPDESELHFCPPDNTLDKPHLKDN